MDGWMSLAQPAAWQDMAINRREPKRKKETHTQVLCVKLLEQGLFPSSFITDVVHILISSLLLSKKRATIFLARRLPCHMPASMQNGLPGAVFIAPSASFLRQCCLQFVHIHMQYKLSRVRPSISCLDQHNTTTGGGGGGQLLLHAQKNENIFTKNVQGSSSTTSAATSYVE